MEIMVWNLVQKQYKILNGVENNARYYKTF
jgi:hypothetical protein